MNYRCGSEFRSNVRQLCHVRNVSASVVWIAANAKDSDESIVRNGIASRGTLPLWMEAFCRRRNFGRPGNALYAEAAALSYVKNVSGKAVFCVPSATAAASVPHADGVAGKGCVNAGVVPDLVSTRA